MILRRIKKHVTDQNWFAVFIDFLIVVIGVFMGLQVQEWALEKERQVDEEAYLKRLYNEVIELGTLRERYDITRPYVLNMVNKSYQKLTSTESTEALTNMECNSLFWVSSVYRTEPPSEVPIITELLSAGRLETISSEALRIEILSFIQSVNKARDLILVVQADKSQLAIQYPDLFKLSLGTSDLIKTEETVLDAVCDVKAIKSNYAFMNALTFEITQYTSYFVSGVLPVSQKLVELRHALETELGIKHTQKEEQE